MNNTPAGVFERPNWQSKTVFEDGANEALTFDDLAMLKMHVRYNFGTNPKLRFRDPIFKSSRVFIGKGGT